MPPAFFTSPFAASAATQEEEPPAGAGFVMLEGTEAIGAEMLRQAQEGEAGGEDENVAEYELASLRPASGRTAAATSDEEEEGSDVGGEDEEDTLSLSDLPKDLRGLCRRLRGEPPSSDDEDEEEQEAEDPASPASLTTPAADGATTKAKAKAPAARRRKHSKGGAQHQQPFLCWAWPLGAREALFWLVALAFLGSFVLIILGGAGGRYRRHYHAMGRTRAGLSRRACPASAAPPAPYAYAGMPSFSGVERSVGLEEGSVEGEGEGGILFITPAEARRLVARARAAEEEARLLKAERGDREEELAWMRSTQYGLETQVRCLRTQLAAARKEAAVLRTQRFSQHHTYEAAATEQQSQAAPEPAPGRSPSRQPLRVPTIVKVIPEARVVKPSDPRPWPTASDHNASSSLHFHPPLSFMNALHAQQQGPKPVAATKAKAPPAPQAEPKSYAEMGVAAAEEEDSDWEWSSEEEEWSDSEWEEDWSDSEDDGWTDSDEEWDEGDWTDDEWSDDEEEGEWVEWCAVDEAEAQAEEEAEAPSAVRIPTSKWTEATYQQPGTLSCGVQEGRAKPDGSFFKPPLEFADRCAAPASPLMQ